MDRRPQSRAPLSIALLVMLVFGGCDGMSSKPVNVIQHRSPGNPQVIGAVEYILPADEMPAEVLGGLHPWIRQMHGKRSAEVKQMLVQRWSTIKNPALQELRDRLLEFQPTSIVVHKGQGWLHVKVPSAESGIGDHWYLSAPNDEIDWLAKLQEVGMQDNQLLAEFLPHFSGLREDIPDMAGNFLDASEWETFPLPGYELHQVKSAKDWQGSLLLFHARNGNSVLLHPSGRCGWWWFAEHEASESHPDLESFIRDFTRFSREYSWPFDGYGADPEHRRR